MAALGTQAIVERTVVGNKRMHYGTCTGETTPAHVVTGLTVVDGFWPAGIDDATDAYGAINSPSNGLVMFAGANTKLYRWYALGR